MFKKRAFISVDFDGSLFTCFSSVFLTYCGSLLDMWIEGLQDYFQNVIRDNDIDDNEYKELYTIWAKYIQLILNQTQFCLLLHMFKKI